MTTEAKTSAIPAADDQARPRAGRAGLWRRVGRLAFWIVVAGLAGFNLWWWGRDAWPLADLNTISGWMDQERYDEAGRALREHLRRSPHHGDARLMLARVLVARGEMLAAA